MTSPTSEWFDVEVITPGRTRIVTIQVERREPPRVPQWRIIMPDAVARELDTEYVIGLVQANTREVQRLAAAVEDLAALLLIGRRRDELEAPRTIPNDPPAEPPASR